MAPDAYDIRTGPAYEADRPALLSRLAGAVEHLRVDLGSGLVLVFATGETLRTALEETLRVERAREGDDDRMLTQVGAFGGLAPGPSRLAATLVIDLADPVALADRLAELPGLGENVSLEVAGARLPATAGAAGDGSGAIHLLFEPDQELRAILLSGGPVAVVVDHPGCHLRVDLRPDQLAAASADLRP